VNHQTEIRKNRSQKERVLPSPNQKLAKKNKTCDQRGDIGREVRKNCHLRKGRHLRQKEGETQFPNQTGVIN
jgi:hypothetical protein